MMNPVRFLFEGPAPAVVDTLRALERAGFLAEPPRADDAQLATAAAHPITDALRNNPAPPWDALAALLAADAPAGSGEVFLYARLTAPADLAEPTRQAALAALGRLERAADERAPFDPFEVVLPIALGDLSGAARARRFAGWQTLHVEGMPEQLSLLRPARTPTRFALARAYELRVLEQTGAYLAFALAHAGALSQPAYLAALADD